MSEKPFAGEFLMCDPRFFGVQYVINPWMVGKLGAVNHEIATEQWNSLYQLLTETMGASVERLEPQTGLPDMVFVANAASVRNNICVLAHMHSVHRQGEEPYYRAWFANRGYAVIDLPREIRFEGAGDALFGEIDEGETILFCASGFRSDPAAQPYIKEAFAIEIVPLTLIDPRYYHLDTCFCPLPGSNYLWYPAAFTPESQSLIEGVISPDRRYAVSDADAMEFACNAVSVGEHTVVINAASDNLISWLSGRGLTTRKTPLTEFLKAGGSAKCLTLRLDH